MGNDLNRKPRNLREQIAADRARLLAINDMQALKLSESDRYQRMRFLREIEADKMVARNKAAHPTDEPKVKKVIKFWGPGNPDYDRMLD